MFDASRWSVDGEAARVVDLNESGALQYLADYYGQAQPRVLREVLAHAYGLGAQTAVVEFRYMDADYRSEHSRFYSTTFRRYPSAAHRIHFFAEPATDALNDPDEPVRFGGLGYLGYCVARPVPGAPVGRVLLRPPSFDPVPDALCMSRETVNLFGEKLSVEGTPFMAQDAQMSRCAHTALWVVARHHHLRGHGPKILPGDIADTISTEAGAGRTIPSPGLTMGQLSASASRLGLPPLVYDLNQLPPGETPLRIICRYLNSALPVIVLGRGHAFVLTGYRRVNPGEPDARIEFIRQDDEAGAYQLVPDYSFDDYSRWEYVVVPLPPKLYVAGEEAEVVGRAWLQAAFAREGTPLATDPSSFAEGVAFTSTAILSNTYKTQLEDRGLPANQATVVRRAHMSRWVWVVQAVDRRLRRLRHDSVLGEVIIDSTDHARDHRPLVLRTPNSITVFSPDTRKEDTTTIATPSPALPHVQP